jgi:hypothetical protein
MRGAAICENVISAAMPTIPLTREGVTHCCARSVYSRSILPAFRAETAATALLPVSQTVMNIQPTDRNAMQPYRDETGNHQLGRHLRSR